MARVITKSGLRRGDLDRTYYGQELTDWWEHQRDRTFWEEVGSTLNLR
jgi:hypothetical protein